MVALTPQDSEVTPVSFRGRMKDLALAVSTDAIPEEILLEGPAGTGKSFTLGLLFDTLLWKHPGFRLLLCRQTRVSMSESVLATLENKVWSPSHPAVLSGGGRAQRLKYTYPNGSEIVLAGLDQPTRILSTEFDAIWVNEVQEITEDSWETLLTRLRNGVYPFPFAIGDCNPADELHWANQRADKIVDHQPMMWRLKTLHADNPFLDGDPMGYVSRLSRLTGVRRARLYEGRWVAAEGLVWPTYDAHKHRVSSFSLNESNEIVGMKPPIHRWRGVYGSIDWGHRNPGCFQLWAEDFDGTLTRFAEVYQKERTHGWWADVIGALTATFEPDWIVCDPEDADGVTVLKRHLHKLGVSTAVRLAKKKKKLGLATVRDYFGDDRLKLSHGALHVRDMIELQHRLGMVDHPHVQMMLEREDNFEDLAVLPNGPQDILQFDRQPTRFEEEISGYCYPVTKEGTRRRDEPDPLAVDHACDTCRYFVEEYWSRKHRPKAGPGKGESRGRRAASP